MRDKDNKESTVTRWVDDQGQQQIVSFYFFDLLNTLVIFFIIIGNESW